MHKIRKKTAKEDRKMEHLAHASVYHWLEREDATAQNLSIGYWQLSRVYATLGEAPRADYYAKVCIRISEDEGLPPFYIGFAYEAAARADRLTGADAGGLLAKARSLTGEVVDAEEKGMLLADLDSLG